MIVNDAPAFRKALPHQRENSTDIPLRTREMPMSEHQCGIRAEKAKFKVGKVELAHRRAVGVIFLVACEHAIPAASNPAASRKCQIRRMPVALHKCVDIPLVPLVLLRLKKLRNRTAL